MKHNIKIKKAVKSNIAGRDIIINNNEKLLLQVLKELKEIRKKIGSK